MDRLFVIIVVFGIITLIVILPIGFKVDLVSKKGIKEKYLKAIDSDLIYV